MTRRKLKIFLMLLAMPLLLAAEPLRDTLPVFTAGDITEETGFTFLTVNPLDEVLIGFPSGNVYLYDAEDTFVCRYKFPSMDALYQVTLDEDGRIKCYVPRTDTLSVYDRSGKLLGKIKLKNRREREEAGVEESNHVNSEGVTYVKRLHKIVKVYPNGNEVLFCKLNDSFETKAEKVFATLLIILVLYDNRKNIISKLQALSPKKTYVKKGA